MFELFSDSEAKGMFTLLAFFALMFAGSIFNYFTECKYTRQVDRAMFVALMLMCISSPAVGIIISVIMFLLVYNAIDFTVLVTNPDLKWFSHHKLVFKQALRSFAGF